MVKDLVAAQPMARQQGAVPVAALNPQAQTGQEQAKTAPPAVALEEKGDRVAVRGRVLDPDGKPLSGADITL